LKNNTAITGGRNKQVLSTLEFRSDFSPYVQIKIDEALDEHRLIQDIFFVDDDDDDDDNEQQRKTHR
jgi:hypothetical protein